jgi:indole-3-glycerol phosphate synthase
MGSPRHHVDAGETSRHMEVGGAVAISVVTEPRFFKGSPSLLEEVRSRIALPLLMKDFIVSPVQVQAARGAGANAILLIQKLFDRGYAACGLDEMIEFAHVAELEVLLETHAKAEFERALRTEADLIGINNRDLRTLNVDFTTTKDILESVPVDGRTVVSESGVVTPADARFLRRCGADALLVGSSLMRAENVRQAVEGLVRAA